MLIFAENEISQQLTSAAFGQNETISGHKKTAGTKNQLLRNSNLEPNSESEALLKAYTNLTSGSYLMLFIQSSLDRRVEIQEVDGKINPIIIHSSAQVHFGLALKDNSSLVLAANILGTNDTVYLNQHQKVRIQPENDIYKQAHIVLTATNGKQIQKVSPYKTNYGGENSLNMTSQIQSLLGSNGSGKDHPKENVLVLSFQNLVGAVVEINEITGAIGPIELLPYENKTIRFVVKKTWPLILHASSGKTFKKLQVNGQRQLRIYLPLEGDGRKDIIVTGRNEDTPEFEEVKAIMLSINNTLKKPIVVFDVSNAMRPLVVPETRICQVGFFVKNADYVALSGLTLGENATGVQLNGERMVTVRASQDPAQQNLLFIEELSKVGTNGSAANGTKLQNENCTSNNANPSGSAPNKFGSMVGEHFVMLKIDNTLDSAVKFIELTGAQKPFLVPSHSDTRVGFSVVHKGPIVLKAMYHGSNKYLMLNNRNSLRIEPSDSASKLTEISVSETSNTTVASKRLVRPSLPQLILSHK